MVKPVTKTKSKKNSPPWTFYVEQAYKGFRSLFLEAWQGVKSPDFPFRGMSFIFLGSVLGIFLVVLQGWHHHKEKNSLLQRKPAQVDITAKNLNEFLEKQAEEAKRKYTLLGLGNFLVELKKNENLKEVKGVVNMAELELFVECDSKKTCDFLSNHVQESRDQLTNVFTAIDRDEFMTKDGKSKIRRAIVDRLTGWVRGWIRDGKIQNAYFSKFVVS